MANINWSGIRNSAMKDENEERRNSVLNRIDDLQPRKKDLNELIYDFERSIDEANELLASLGY